ncbi:MAG: hypothetical protein LM571_00245 [Desulfurococcaceae archaeon]|nr:hypothetical protein [Desulfurococcaceae archaeon]
MIRVSREAVYRFRKGGVEGVVEIVAGPRTRYVVLHKVLKGKYTIEDREEEWNLLEHQAFKDVKDVVVDYGELPLDIRRALARARS